MSCAIRFVAILTLFLTGSCGQRGDSYLGKRITYEESRTGEVIMFIPSANRFLVYKKISDLKNQTDLGGRLSPCYSKKNCLEWEDIYLVEFPDTVSGELSYKDMKYVKVQTPYHVNQYEVSGYRNGKMNVKYVVDSACGIVKIDIYNRNFDGAVIGSYRASKGALFRKSQCTFIPEEF